MKKFFGLLFLGVAIAACSTTSHKEKDESWTNDKKIWDDFNRGPAQVRTRDSNLKQGEESVVGLHVVKVSNTVSIEESEESELTSPPLGEWGKACGELFHGESSHNALNDEHAYYFIRLNCESVGSNGQGNYFAKFAPNAMSPQRRGVLTRFRNAAAKKEKSRRAVPFICFQGSVSAQLCERQRNVVIQRVDEFTADVEKFKRWRPIR